MKPYKQQLEAVKSAVTMRRGGVVMPTGTGKSVAMALLINELQVRTLIVVPNLELKKQLSETFIKLFGSLDNITIENIDSPVLRHYDDYGLLLIDECHHSASLTYQRLNKTAWSKIYYRFFFTATFFRNQDNEQLKFEGICGQVIYNLTYKEAVTAGMIVPIEAYYIEVPKQKNDLYSWQEVYNQLIVNNEIRNNLITSLIERLYTVRMPTITLVKEIAHGKLLEELSGAPFTNGQDENSRPYIGLFNVGILRTIIGTTGVLGEGSDTKPCQFIIIAGLGKAKSAFMQQVGRAVRKYPGKESAKVIIFSDKSHKFTKAHFKEQKKILLDEYGVIPIKLEL